MVSTQLKIYNSIAESVYMTVSTMQSEKFSDTPFVGRQAQLNQPNNSAIPNSSNTSYSNIFLSSQGSQPSLINQNTAAMHINPSMRNRFSQSLQSCQPSSLSIANRYSTTSVRYPNPTALTSQPQPLRFQKPSSNTTNSFHTQGISNNQTNQQASSLILKSQ